MRACGHSQLQYGAANLFGAVYRIARKPHNLVLLSSLTQWLQACACSPARSEHQCSRAFLHSRGPPFGTKQYDTYFKLPSFFFVQDLLARLHAIFAAFAYESSLPTSLPTNKKSHNLCPLQPVRDLFLEDILERTGHKIGRTSKWVEIRALHAQHVWHSVSDQHGWVIATSSSSILFNKQLAVSQV